LRRTRAITTHEGNRIMATRKRASADTAATKSASRKAAKSRTATEVREVERTAIARGRTGNGRRSARLTLAQEMAEIAESAPAVRPVAVTRAARVAAPSGEARLRMIREAAYFIAQRRGFAGGDAQSDWLEAERQIDAQFGTRKPRTRRASA